MPLPTTTAIVAGAAALVLNGTPPRSRSRRSVYAPGVGGAVIEPLALVVAATATSEERASAPEIPAPGRPVASSQLQSRMVCAALHAKLDVFVTPTRAAKGLPVATLVGSVVVSYAAANRSATVRPLRAFSALTRPKPNPSSRPGSPRSSAVCSIRWKICCAVNVGCALQISAASPATKGDAWLVPLNTP